MTPRWPVVVGALALGAAGGCGGSPSPGAVVMQALESHSPSRCDLYTDAFFEREVGTSAQAGRGYCRRVAATLPVASPRITRVDVHGSAAAVTAVASGKSVTYRLVRRRGRWLIDSLSG